MATHSSLLARKIPWTGDYSPGCHKESDTTEYTHIHTHRTHLHEISSIRQGRQPQDYAALSSSSRTSGTMQFSLSDLKWFLVDQKSRVSRQVNCLQHIQYTNVSQSSVLIPATAVSPQNLLDVKITDWATSQSYEIRKSGLYLWNCWYNVILKVWGPQTIGKAVFSFVLLLS